ncbi:MAG: SGNH/GDSL hydrolase family protein, partial [Planctomycetota bacterium]
EGGLIFLAAKGTALLEAVKIDVPEIDEETASALPDRFLGAALPLGFLLLYCLLATFMLKVKFLPLLEAHAFALLPLAFCFSRLSTSGGVDYILLGTTALLSCLIYFFYLMMHSVHLTKVKYFVLVILILCGAAFWFRCAVKRGWPVDHIHVSRMSFTEWSVDALHEDLIHLEHPLLRRWNVYLAEHKLRDRYHDSEKKPGTSRILALGTSSTHGYWVKRNYSFILEEMLKKDGFDVEMIVGAYPGATGVRVYPFLKNVLLDFEPDIITLSLYYNDALALIQFDEADYLDRIVEPSYSLLDRFKDRIASWIGAYRTRMLEKVFIEVTAGRAEPLVAGPDDAPARYEKMLRRYAELCKQEGIPLVFIKEPVAGDMKRIWKEEFYSAMDLVGAEYGLPVVDPTPMLVERGGVSLFMDNVHPLEQGGAVIAEALFPVIRGLLGESRVKKAERGPGK